ncbi:MAG TPA: hypothetical protein VM782_08480 [Stellaceae bacterium]|nr:hypothetical protein [Stellaceae bacterium]
MSLLVTVVQIEVWLFVGALALIVFFRLVAGHIDLGGAGMHRLQLLITTLGLAIYYVAQVTGNPHATALPDLNPAAVAGFGSSGLVYLVTKLVKAWPDITGNR